MSKDNKKFAIIFGGLDYFIFEICDKSCKILLEHKKSPDCNFAEMEDLDDTYIVCNLNK